MDCLHWLRHAGENVSSHYSPTYQQNICSNYPGVTLSLSTDCTAKENCSDPASFQCTKFHRDQQIRSLRDITRTNHAAKITRCTCCFHRAIHPAHEPVLVAGPKVVTDNFVSNEEVALMAAKIFSNLREISGGFSSSCQSLGRGAGGGGDAGERPSGRLAFRCPGKEITQPHCTSVPPK